MAGHTVDPVRVVGISIVVMEVARSQDSADIVKFDWLDLGLVRRNQAFVSQP